MPVCSGVGTGNHDYGGLTQARSLPWPNIVIIDDAFQLVEVQSDGRLVGVVGGAGHNGPKVMENLAATFPKLSYSVPTVGLLHCQVASSLAPEEPYAPCTKGDLQNKGYDYWALGHIHKPQRVLEAPLAHYSGSLIGNNPKEEGPRGVLLVELTKDYGRVKFCPTAPVQWLRLTPDLRDVRSFEDLFRVLRGLVPKDAENLLVRVEFAGPSPLSKELGRMAGEPDQWLELGEEIRRETGAPGVELKLGTLTGSLDRRSISTPPCAGGGFEHLRGIAAGPPKDVGAIARFGRGEGRLRQRRKQSTVLGSIAGQFGPGFSFENGEGVVGWGGTMQIARIEIEAFGHLKDLTVELGESTLVLVQGANEAGKSTLFNFLVTMLYGFSPANQAQFPYVPWAGGRPAGAVEVVLDDGARYRIERNLASRPAGSLLRQGISKSLRNQTVPWVVSIPRALFGEIFMLTQEQMQVFGPRTWEQVGDQLVTGIGTSFLRPVTEVAEESAREARKLWREDRRRTRVRDLRERVKELQGQRSTLVTVQDELRGIQRQEEELRLQAKALREEREQLTAFLEEARLLKPVHEQLQRIEELSKTRWKEEVASLPQQIEEQFQGVTDQLRENERQQRELRSRIEQLAPLDPTLEQAMGLSEEIRALQKEEPFYAEQQRQLERLQEDLHRLDEKLKGTVESLAGPGDLVRRVTALEAGLLDAITARIRQLNADLEATSPPTMVLGWVSLGLAFLCILLGMSFSSCFIRAAPLAGVSIARSLA